MNTKDLKSSTLDAQRFSGARKNIGDDQGIARLSCRRRRAVMASIETTYIV